jgi:hypothetical protein
MRILATLLLRPEPSQDNRVDHETCFIKVIKRHGDLLIAGRHVDIGVLGVGEEFGDAAGVVPAGVLDAV